MDKENIVNILLFYSLTFKDGKVYVLVEKNPSFVVGIASCLRTFGYRVFLSAEGIRCPSFSRYPYHFSQINIRFVKEPFDGEWHVNDKVKTFEGSEIKLSEIQIKFESFNKEDVMKNKKIKEPKLEIDGFEYEWLGIDQILTEEGITLYGRKLNDCFQDKLRVLSYIEEDQIVTRYVTSKGPTMVTIERIKYV